MFPFSRKDFVEEERRVLTTLSQKDKEKALILLAQPPVKTYLMSVIDELVRQGIYLKPNEQEGVKKLVEVLGREIEKGTKLLNARKK